MTASISQTVTGSVLNDYGLDNIPFTMNGPCNPASSTMGNWLVAFIGWDIGFFTYQSSGKSPAVNVTDSAGNLWRQVGITPVNTGSRAAIWVAVNARQVSWVSVALTGWSYSTSYTICEVTGIPAGMQTVAIDFVSTAVSSSAVTTLTVPSATEPAGWSFTAQGTPVNNTYFIATTAQAANIYPGQTFTSSNNAGITFTVTAVAVPFAGFVNVQYTPSTPNVRVISNPSTVTYTAPAGSDIVFGVMAVGTNGSAPSTPAGWTALTQSPSAPAQYTETVFPYWIPSQGAGTVAFAPSWTTAGPAAGIIVGLKQAAPAPIQSRTQFPRVVVEAAFGANPGDWTQSVDYTWSSEGVFWTDLTSRCITNDNEARIRLSRGRGYELTQEETGELTVWFDNHDGMFTYANANSFFNPYVIPGTPVRVTAWWSQTSGNPIQYPVSFGYAERWVQHWPDLPQWGFTEMIAVDAYGPLASTSLPSAVEGEIRKDAPYAYFPTDEQYSFTQSALVVAGNKIPIDANGFYAINRAFGNNRVGAYRDGSDGIASQTGQALNLLGDSDTDFGAPNYPGLIANVGGPGMFYVDPGLPTNSTGSQAFTIEFWFLLGWPSGKFSVTLFSAYARPSSYYPAGGVYSGSNKNGAVILVEANTNKTPGLQFNRTVVATATTSPSFKATNANPQHFVMTCSPANGTTTYLNGVKTAVQPTNLPSIPQLKAMVLGPGRWSYDNSFLPAYQGYNFVAGHLAVYSQEITPTMIANHYSSGITGFIAQQAQKRFSQVLTWGLLGLKRGGSMWVGGTYKQPESTLVAEAFSFEGTTAGDVMGQLTQTEGGRCFTQANGSLVYVPRWLLYNNVPVATFGDDGVTEIPFSQGHDIDVDEAYIYNLVTATQTRGPNSDIFYQVSDPASQLSFFNRSGLSFSSSAMSPFDVYGAVNWNLAKYRQPQQRIGEIEVNPAATQGKLGATFATVLGLELQQTVTVNRRPIGGGAFAVTGPIQKIQHEIGANQWSTKITVTPRAPENSVLIPGTGSNTPGSNYLAW